MSKLLNEELSQMMELIKGNSNFVIIDIETTGFTPLKGGRIIEIGAVKLKDNVLVDRFDEFVNPDMKIPKKIIELTGITNEDVAEADTINKVLNRLYNFIDKESVLVFHNKRFDWDTFLTYYFSKAGIVCSNPSICTLKLSKYLYPNKISYKLFDLVSEIKEGISKDNTHRADYDAELTSYLLLDMKENILSQSSLKKDENSQLSLLSNMVHEEKLPKQSPKEKEATYDYKIRNINFWRKKFSNKLYERLYVYLNCGVVYYDFNQKEWGAKDCSFTLNFNQIENLLLKVLRKTNLEEVFEYYNEKNSF